MKDHNSRLVYSTDSNVQRKKKLDARDLESSAKPEHQKVIVRKERKGRGGKTVTVVECLVMNQNSKLAFLKQLKSKLGTGGTIRDDCSEFQGDHCSILYLNYRKWDISRGVQADRSSSFMRIRINYNICNRRIKNMRMLTHV